MNKIKISKEGHSMMKWPSRGWYVSARGGSHYLTPTLKWQNGVNTDENCFVKTRKLARERLKAWREQQKAIIALCA